MYFRICFKYNIPQFQPKNNIHSIFKPEKGGNILSSSPRLLYPYWGRKLPFFQDVSLKKMLKRVETSTEWPCHMSGWPFYWWSFSVRNKENKPFQASQNLEGKIPTCSVFVPFFSFHRFSEGTPTRWHRDRHRQSQVVGLKSKVDNVLCTLFIQWLYDSIPETYFTYIKLINAITNFITS